MADHLSEEEQLEAFKNWWKEYWVSVVVPILVAAGSYFLWNVWQENKQAKAEMGSIQYQELVKVLEVQPGQELPREKKAEAQVLAEEIISEFSKSLYADHANMVLARFAMEDKNPDEAVEYLTHVVEHGKNKAMTQLASVRLARIKISQGDYDGAISLVSTAPGAAYKSLYAEVRADALASKGQLAEANTAYQEALEGLQPQQYTRRNILQMKLNGSKVITEAVQAKGETPVTENKQESSNGADNAEEEQAPAPENNTAQVSKGDS